MNFLIKLLFVVGCMGCIEKLFGYSPAQVKAFKKALQSSGQVANCSGCDFRGVDLHGLDAHTAFLPGVNFQTCVNSAINKNSSMICIAGQVANLTGINLANVFLFSSNFNQAILDGANLSGADVSSSSFLQASLKGAQVAGMITTNATFCNAIMPDGKVCTDLWTGQGVTIACNCTTQDAPA